jgi:hypothetical protein
MMQSILAAPILIVLVAMQAQDGTPRFVIPPPSEMVHIDGRKNPEMIPEWAAWEFAFRVIAGGSRQLPTDVHRHVSKDDAALIVAEAVENQKRDKACQDRMVRLYARLQTESADKTREIQIECRWQTLYARDRVLAALQPEGQAALAQWVESTKETTQVTVAKRELAHYQRPH